MTTLTDTQHAGHFIADEANGWRSRDQVLVTTGTLLAGTVLGRTAVATSAGLMVSRAAAANVGNGALTVDSSAPVGTTGKTGVYKAVLTTAAANGGTFTVYDPLDAVVGTVAVAATFNTQIKFVIADGATDFALGDTFYLTVSREAGTYGILAPGGSGGIEVAAGILFDDADASVLPVRAVAMVRDCEVNGDTLIWPAGITATQKATAITQLAALGVVVR